jgi:hypothetical protein
VNTADAAVHVQKSILTDPTNPCMPAMHAAASRVCVRISADVAALGRVPAAHHAGSVATMRALIELACPLHGCLQLAEALMNTLPRLVLDDDGAVRESGLQCIETLVNLQVRCQSLQSRHTNHRTPGHRDACGYQGARPLQATRHDMESGYVQHAAPCIVACCARPAGILRSHAWRVCATPLGAATGVPGAAGRRRRSLHTMHGQRACARRQHASAVYAPA